MTNSVFAPQTITPVHEHDCDCCKFCGNFVKTGDSHARVWDLYYCREQSTLIARGGDQGDYISASPEIASHYPATHPITFLYTLLKARKVIKANK